MKMKDVLDIKAFRFFFKCSVHLTLQTLITLHYEQSNLASLCDCFDTSDNNIFPHFTATKQFFYISQFTMQSEKHMYVYTDIYAYF